MDSAGQILFAIGLGSLLMGGFKSSLLLRGTTRPESVTIAQLGNPDGTSNVHLTVTDYRFGKHIVTLKEDGSWQRVWIPLLTEDGKWTQRPVVVHSKYIKNRAQLGAVLKRERVTGVASNFMQSLGSNQQQQFARFYPNDDLRGAIALELDASMPSPWIAYPLLLLGIVTFPASLRMLYLAYFQPTPPSEQGSDNSEMDSEPPTTFS
jgi:hypothetical protein